MSSATFTIDKLVNGSAAQGLKIVAGQRAVGNVITNVNTIDNPDSYDWLSPGDFVLTTGYVFKDDPTLQRQVIREISEINCAGMGVKVQRYWDEVPQRMIDEAEKRGLPIIRIPYTYSLAQITNIINNEIFLREDTLLKRYQEIHEVFTRCALNGGSLGEITQLASQMIDNPLVVVDSGWNLLEYAEHEENPHRLADYLPLVPREKVFPHSFVSGIPDSVDKFAVSIKRRYPDQAGSIVCRVIPVAAGKIIYGYLVVWETVKKLQKSDYMALEMAATTAALERVKTRQMEEARHQMRQDFFDDLLQGKIASVNAVNSLAEIHGMDPRKKYVCTVLKVLRMGEYERLSLHGLMSSLSDIAQYTGVQQGRKLTAIHRGSILILFVEAQEGKGRFKPDKDFCDFAEKLDENVAGEYPGLDYRIGVSGICIHFLDMGKHYRMAQEALRISDRLLADGRLFYFSDLFSYHLLDNAFDKKHLEEFLQTVLGALIEYDQVNNTQMISTLHHYFQAGCNISAAAKAMYIHRNTFIYRIEKIKTILNTDFKDGEEVFSLQLALHILRVMELYTGRKDGRSPK